MSKQKNQPEYPGYDEDVVREWMRDNYHNYFRNGVKTVPTPTDLAECYCFEFKLTDWLDDETHPIWDLAVLVCEEFEA